MQGVPEKQDTSYTGGKRLVDRPHANRCQSATYYLEQVNRNLIFTMHPIPVHDNSPAVKNN